MLWKEHAVVPLKKQYLRFFNLLFFSDSETEHETTLNVSYHSNLGQLCYDVIICLIFSSAKSVKSNIVPLFSASKENNIHQLWFKRSAAADTHFPFIFLNLISNDILNKHVPATVVLPLIRCSPFYMKN